MSKMTTSTIAACGFIAAAFAPLAVEARADVSVFSGSEAFISANFANYSYDSQIYRYMEFRAFENASRSKSVKGVSSGAYVYGSAWDGTYNYSFYGDTTSITFKAQGALPNNVTASGSIPVIVTICDALYENCTDSADTVIFNLNADALKDSLNSSSGVGHDKFGITKINHTYDFDWTYAAFSDDSSIVSPFGTLTHVELGGFVGNSKSHSLSINYDGGI